MTRDEMRGIPIERCDFGKGSVRIGNHLPSVGIDTLGKLIDATHADLIQARSIGKASIDAINGFLVAIGEHPKVGPGKRNSHIRLTADEIRRAMDSP